MSDLFDEIERRAEARRGWSRRHFLGLGAAVGGAVFLGACGGDDDSASGGGGGGSGEKMDVDSITIANWGGTTSDGMVRAWAQPFTQKYGVQVKVVSPVDYGKVRTQVESKKVTWDWIDAEGWFPYGNPDLIEKLDHDYIGVQKADFVDGIPDAVRPDGLSSYLTAYVIAYNTEKKGAHPKNWQEFFDPKAVPGKRSIYNWPYGMVELALLGDGVAFDDLYPLDLDRAFNKMDSIRDDLMFFNTGAESQQQLISGAADFVSPWNNRVGYLAQGGLPVAIEWNQGLNINAFHVVIKGAGKAKRATEAYIKTAMDPKNQADMALYSGYAPTMKAALPMVDDKIRPHLVTTEENYAKTIGFIDDEWWGKNLTDVSAKWTDWASS
jgi:putative spermidine/putrescine transport system substrate-binding protein